MKLTTMTLMIGLLSSGAYAATQEAPSTSSSAIAKPAASTAVTQGDTSASVTATCKDGTSFSGASKKGACSGHKGVKTWGSSPAMPGTEAEAKADAKADAKSTGQKASAPLATAAAGGGAGKVWLNSKSNTYHCQSDRYYGKTKAGAYMTEAEAKAKGAHADHGKACA
jgi:hypothetical protein